MIDIAVGLAALLVALGASVLVIGLMVTEPLVAVPTVALFFFFFFLGWAAVQRIGWVRQLWVASKGLFVVAFLGRAPGQSRTQRRR